MAALFGYGNEAEFEKQIEQDNSGHLRNPNHLVKSDDDRCAFLIVAVSHNFGFVCYVSCFLLVWSITNKISYVSTIVNMSGL